MFDNETILKTRCTCCNRSLDEYEDADPIIIDGFIFKDSCAGDLTSLRLQGFIKEVSTRTRVLKEAHDWTAYNKASFGVMPFTNLKHI